MPSCPACRTILGRLRDPSKYLSQYHASHQSMRFEELVCQAFAVWLHVPFYDADNDDSTVQYRMTWLGSAHKVTKAPAGPDGIARAHGFYIVVEATRKTGTSQWSQELARCVDHATKVAQDNNAAPNDVYAVLVTEKLHRDTYTSVKSYNATGEYKIVLIGLDDLRTAVETSHLAFTIRHLEVRKLLGDLLGCCSRADSLRSFTDGCRHTTDGWQKETLQLEQAVTVAVKSYEAMLREGRNQVGVSDILKRLSKHPTVRSYFGKIGSTLRRATIVESLTQESLGALLCRNLTTGEELFCPVPLADFKSRCARRMSAVEAAHASK